MKKVRALEFDEFKIHQFKNDSQFLQNAQNINQIQNFIKKKIEFEEIKNLRKIAQENESSDLILLDTDNEQIISNFSRNAYLVSLNYDFSYPIIN